MAERPEGIGPTMTRDARRSAARAGARALAALTVVSALIASSGSVEGGRPGTDGASSGPGRIAGTQSLMSAAARPVPPRAPSAHPKLDAAMSAIADSAAADADLAGVAREQGLRIELGRVQVVLDIDRRGLDGVLSAIRSEGGSVTSRADGDALLQAWLRPDSLARLSRLPSVRAITAPQAPTLLEGSSLTEGLAAMTNSGDWHAAGYTGAGVEIAVVDAGFTGYPARQGSSDLPAALTVENFIDGQGDPEVDTGTPHGTAVAEIVHDVAPDATLHLVKVGTNLDLAQAVDYAIAQDVDIITTSLGWFNLTPGDGTGFFDAQVDEARAAGILWTTAAANSRGNYYDGAFSDGNGDGFHQFSGADDLNAFGATPGECWRYDAGFTFRVYLSWNDWTNVDKDYDLHIYRWPGSGGWVYVDGSTNNQAGAFPTPTEAVSVTTMSGNCYAFAIEKVSGGAADLRVHIPNWDRPAYFDNQRSLSDLADAPAAVTVAALDAQNAAYPQEPYSSEGPAMGPGGSIGGGATTMDLSAYARVDTEAYGPNVFNGTSAATPHVAGAAALVMEANSSFTLAQVEASLAGRAQDMGAAGTDRCSALVDSAWVRRRQQRPLARGWGPARSSATTSTTRPGSTRRRVARRRAQLDAFGISVQNDGTAADSFKLLGAGSSTHYNVKYLDGTTIITSQVVAGTYTTPSLPPGGSHLITAKVTVKSTAPAGSR